MSETAIRLLRPEDHEALTALMVEMQGHYSVPCPATEEILAGLAALPAGVDILIAVKGAAVLGFASGRKLMAALAELALERGHRRIDWTADADDAALLRFYDGLGAATYPKKVFYRLTGDALVRLASADQD
jgi:GNAT superfamily N-acetyltransferase